MIRQMILQSEFIRCRGWLSKYANQTSKTFLFFTITFCWRWNKQIQTLENSKFYFSYLNICILSTFVESVVWWRCLGHIDQPGCTCTTTSHTTLYKLSKVKFAPVLVGVSMPRTPPVLPFVLV